MSQVYTFHRTARGHLHELRERPCEDYSGSFSAEDGMYHIAAVADGHGADACFRSAYGSRAAVEIAIQCLKEFAEPKLASPETEKQFYNDLFSNPRYRQMSVRLLTDTILARWHDRVCTDYEENPPTPDEAGDGLEAGEGNAAEHNISHVYGTTLIAALWMPGCLLLLHQGDGRCDVFYQDGGVEQPIPWDARCEDTAVTSLCDTDAAESFRSCVLDPEERPVIACYLGSDGVEDAYRDTYEGLGGSHELMGGVHTFYKDLSCKLADLSGEAFEEYLGEMLPEFSASGRFSHSGSGDDVSVAGIVDPDAVSAMADRFRVDVKRYDMEEAYFWKQDELRSKTRKHGILEKRMEEIGDTVQMRKIQLDKVESSLAGAKKACEELELSLKNPRNPLQEYRVKKIYEAEKRDLEAEESEYQKAKQDYEAAEQAYREAEENFREYDVRYREIEEELVRMKAEIDALAEEKSDSAE